jgi:hypothetical protein
MLLDLEDDLGLPLLQFTRLSVVLIPRNSPSLSMAQDHRDPPHLTDQRRQHHGVQHDRHHHAAEQVPAVVMRQRPQRRASPNSFTVVISCHRRLSAAAGIAVNC